MTTRRLSGLLIATALAGSTAAAQTNPLQRFTTGGRDLVVLDFAGTAVGEFPSSVRMINGVMNVVERNGMHMLRASSMSAFLITLSQPLPKDFSVEATLIPKDGFNPEDIAIEGTPVINQGRGSAHLQWQPSSFRVIGGRQNNFEAVLPEAIQATAGRLTQVVFKLEGEQVSFYVNGRLLSTLPDTRFVRGRVLRVTLGGQDDGPAAVYLASLRVVANAPPVGPIVADQSADPRIPTRPDSGGQPQIGTPPRESTSPATSPPNPGSVSRTGTTTVKTPPPPTVGSPSPASTGGVPNAMNDGPAPTVAVMSTPGGIQLKYTNVTDAQSYVVCRESPPGSSCQQVDLGAPVVSGNVFTVFDLGLPANSSHGYRVKAVQPNGHYGEGGPATATTGLLPTPTNLRVSRVTPTPAIVTLEWDPVQYTDNGGSKALPTYELTGTGISTPLIVSGTTASVSLSSSIGTYEWKVASVLVGQNGSVHRSSPSQISYVCRYRVVAIGIHVGRQTHDNVLLFDGAEDEVYLATATGLTNRAVTSPQVTLTKSSTFGDVTGYANRIKAGSATPNGGLRQGDKIPATINVNATGVAPSTSFPLLIWEGPLDDQAVLTLHPMIWEEDKSNRSYIRWAESISTLIRSRYAGVQSTIQAIQQLAAAGDVGPIRPAGAFESCMTTISPLIDECVDGDDRPVGLDAVTDQFLRYDNRFLVLTRAAVEKSLQKALSPQPIAGTAGFNASAPGVISLQFSDASVIPSPMGTGFYYLYLKIERVP